MYGKQHTHFWMEIGGGPRDVGVQTLKFRCQFKLPVAREGQTHPPLMVRASSISTVKGMFVVLTAFLSSSLMVVRTLIPLPLKRAALFPSAVRPSRPPRPLLTPNSFPSHPPPPRFFFLVQSLLQAILIIVITAYKTDVSIKAPRD